MYPSLRKKSIYSFLLLLLFMCGVNANAWGIFSWGDTPKKKEFVNVKHPVQNFKKIESSFEIADDYTYVDDIKINGREFDSLNNEVIEFYRDDLIDGKVTVDGILESDDDSVELNTLFVEISVDGGASWHKASGHSQWQWSFEPELGHEYSFSLRVVRMLDSNDEQEQSPFDVKAYIVYAPEQKSLISDGKVIDVGSAGSVKLQGSISNHTDESKAVHVTVEVGQQTLLSEDMIVPKDENRSFSVDILEKIKKGDNSCHIVVTPATQLASVENEPFIDADFTVAKTDKLHYQIGEYTLVTDAVAVNGKLSGEGSISVDILSKFDNFNGVMDVTFNNLSVNADKKITAGTITYSEDLSYKPLSSVEIIANKVILTPSDAYVEGKLSLKKIGKFVAPLDIDIAHASLQGGNFKLDTDYTWEGAGQNIPLYDGSFGLSLLLKRVHLVIDLKQPLLKMVKISDLYGGIKFGDTFDSTNTSITLKTDGSIHWSLNGSAAIEKSEYFYFDGCSGVVDMLSDEPSVSINGNLKVYFEKGDNPDREHLEVAIGEGLTLDRRGLQGDVGFDIGTIPQKLPDVIADVPVKVKAFHILFDGYVSGGGITFAIDYDDFFKSGKEFHAEVSGDVTSEGFSNFRIEGSEATLSIDDFATLSFENFSLEMVDSKPHFVTDMNVHLPKTDLLEDNVDLKLQHLTLGADGVKLEGGSIWKGLAEGNSATASLYGVEIYLDKIGIGIKDKKLFVGFEGGGGIGGDTISINDMKVAFYKNKTVELLNSPSIDMDTNAVSFHSSLQKTENDTQKGFHARGSLKFKAFGDGLQINAEFMSGGFKSSGHSYWRIAADASTATAIPLTPIPLNLYGFGGGVAYNVVFNMNTKKWAPQDNSGITVSATTIFGTQDGGYTLNGPATLSLGEGGVVTFNTTMYLRAGLGKVVDNRKVELNAQLIPSPFRFYAQGEADITEEASDNFDILEVHGDVDMLFSSSKNYLYIGTKAEPVSANFLEVANSDGYLMLDDSGLAFGYKLSLVKEGHCCGMFGSIDVGTSVDMMIGVRPFYIDAEGKMWAIVAAGIKYKALKYTVFSGGANIAARFRAPEPTWAKFDVSLYYSILNGMVEGRYSMTYWINKPEGGSDAVAITAENLDLIQYIIPFDGEDSVSRIPKIEIATTLPIGKAVMIDDLIDTPTGESYKLFIRKATELGLDTPTFHPATSSNDFIALRDMNDSRNYLHDFMGGVVGTHGNRVVLHANRLFPANHQYRLVVEAYLQEQSSGEVIGRDMRTLYFKTTNDAQMNFRSIVESVHPAPNAKQVYKQSDLYVKVRGLYDMGIEINLYDPLNRKVNDTPWRFKSLIEDASAASQMYAYVYENHPDLNMIVVYECDQTQEVKEAVYDREGKEHNPFTFNEAIYNNTHYAQQSQQSNNAVNYHVSNVPTGAAEATYRSTEEKTLSNRGKNMQKRVLSANKLSEADRGDTIIKQHYTYTRKELRKYTIKAQKRENGTLVDLFSSTFEVYGSARKEIVDKAGNKSDVERSYDNDIDMLQQTMQNPRFVIHRLPIDYEAKEAEWNDFMENSYMPEFRGCDGLVDTYADETSDEEDPHVTECFSALYQRAQAFKEDLDKRYAHGKLESLTLEFEHSGMMDPSNVSMSITPQCRLYTDDGATYLINPDGYAFSNMDAYGNYSGNDAYTILQNDIHTTKIMLNLNQVDSLANRLSQAISNIEDINSKNIRCGYFSIFPRYLTSDGWDASVEQHTTTESGHMSIYKNNVELREE